VIFVVIVELLYVAGWGTFPGQLITASGEVNIFGDLSGYFITSIEQFVNRSPDVILELSTTTENRHFKDQLLRVKAIADLTGENRCILCDPSLVSIHDYTGGTNRR
jgi:ABC-type hemin transport system substrate-binding protein